MLLFSNKLEPKIKYLLKSFSLKKSESTSIMSELKLISFSELSSTTESSIGNAYELIKNGLINKNEKRIAI